jgi:hypothetical protein
MKTTICVLIALAACTSSPPKPDTIYRLRSHGAIDLGANVNARHCSELTRDFRDAYGLENKVQTFQSIAVAADHSRVVLRVDDRAVSASLLIGDAAKLRAFWHYDGWTLALVLDHGSCRGDACSTEISLIKYNGAQTPIERSSKLCFERWVGTLTRERSLL